MLASVLQGAAAQAMCCLALIYSAQLDRSPVSGGDLDASHIGLVHCVCTVVATDGSAQLTLFPTHASAPTPGWSGTLHCVIRIHCHFTSPGLIIGIGIIGSCRSAFLACTQDNCPAKVFSTLCADAITMGSNESHAAAAVAHQAAAGSITTSKGQHRRTECNAPAAGHPQPNQRSLARPACLQRRALHSWHGGG